MRKIGNKKHIKSDRISEKFVCNLIAGNIAANWRINSYFPSTKFGLTPYAKRYNLVKRLKPHLAQGRIQTVGIFFTVLLGGSNGTSQKNDDTKIIAVIVYLFIGFLSIWNIAAHISDIYELRLDAETCNRVKMLGLAPPANCVITVPFCQAGVGIPVGFLALPDGSEIQISPVAANRTNKSAEWSSSMKTQFVMALLFWGATVALLLIAFCNRE